ncbi:MAG: hypothetical protein MSS85_01340 [Pyramidobacter sp.]|uniref:hypothetical protein n=1 Tax=Pyramidobacter sp. TaxID=1943581 RepID=UPI0025E43D8E|nr:hypothetical protein [Pyramidobacter sp.]MCI7402722.1 hypothetical protein [Pyramidobacter sp.]
MKSLFTKKIFVPTVLLLLGSCTCAAQIPPADAPAKSELTSAYIEETCRKMRNIFLDFDAKQSQLSRSSGREVIDILYSQLRESPLKNPDTLVYPKTGTEEDQRIATTYNSLWRVDTLLRPLALQIVNSLSERQIPERIHSRTLAFWYLNDETNVHTTLKDFNDVYLACLETIKTMERNDVPNFSPDEVLIHSNMNVFFNVKGTRKGGFDRTLRTIDHYCDTLKPARLKKLAEHLDELEILVNKLQEKVSEVNAWLASRSWNEDPLSVAAGYELFALRVAQLIKEARELLDKIDSGGTKCGRIRAGTFITGGMMLGSVSDEEEGMPQYLIRSFVAYRICRENYNGLANIVYERHKNEPGVKPQRW